MQDGQNTYLEVFHTELQAFIQRVKEHAAQHDSCQVDSSAERSAKGGLAPNDVLDTSPPVGPAQTDGLHPCSAFFTH